MICLEGPRFCVPCAHDSDLQRWLAILVMHYGSAGGWLFKGLCKVMTSNIFCHLETHHFNHFDHSWCGSDIAQGSDKEWEAKQKIFRMYVPLFVCTHKNTVFAYYWLIRNHMFQGLQAYSFMCTICLIR